MTGWIWHWRSVFFCVALVPLAASADEGVSPNQRYGAEFHYYNQHDPKASKRLTYGELKSRIENEGLESVDQVLASLRKEPRFEKLFRSFVLMHRSQSLHRDDISAKYPRVIFYGDGLVAAIAGDPTKPSYESLEVMDYSPAQARFRFHEIRFRGGISRFDDDSEKCLSCHGSPLRPIWGSYFVWPGAFHGGDEWAPGEKESFAALMKRLGDPDMARYRNFLRKDYELEDAQNFKLGIHLSRLNFHRVFEPVRKSEVYPRYRFAIAAALYECRDIEAFLPPALAKAHRSRLKNAVADLAEHTREVVQDDMNRRLKLYDEIHGSKIRARDNPADFDLAHVPAIASLRYVLEGQSVVPGLRLKDWSISRDPGGWSYNLANGAGGLRDLLHQEIVPEMLALTGSERPECDELKRRSLDALGPLAP